MPKIKDTSKSKSSLFQQINNLNNKLNSVSLYSEAKNSNMRSMFDSKFSKKSFNNIIIIVYFYLIIERKDDNEEVGI